MDETLANIQVQNLKIASWTLLEKQQLFKLNLGIKANPQCIKVNAHLIKEKTKELQTLFKEFKDVFAWTYFYDIVYGLINFKILYEKINVIYHKLYD